MSIRIIIGSLIIGSHFGGWIGLAVYLIACRLAEKS